MPFRRIVAGRVPRLGERLFATTLCALWAWLCFSAPAQAEPLHAALRMADAADVALLVRLRGQTGDLDVTMEGIRTSALESGLVAQLEAARSLANERGLRVIVWAARDEQELQLWIADFALDRVLVRSLAGSSALERSAQEEAAALVTRSALRASLAGRALGQPSEQVVEREQPRPSVPTPPAVIAPPAAPNKEPAAWDAAFELGVLSGIDGATARGHHAATLRAGLQMRRLELALLGGVGLPGAVSAPLAELTLSVHRVEGSAGMSWSTPGGFRFTLALAAGVEVFRLHAEARTATLRARESREALPLLCSFARFGYQPTGWPVGLAIRLGLDVLPSVPVLGYEDGAGFARVHELWRVQPQLGLAVTAP
ncbi:MAG TPA: hypothetical protein VI299_25355 [Polyangiales bacterium]